MVNRARRQQPAPVLGAVGWLFAELALVLVVIVIGAEAPAADPVVPPTSPTPAPTSTAPPTPTPSRTEGLSLKTASFRMAVPADGSGVTEEFRDRLTATIGADGRVGLILLFGVSRDPGVPTAGTLVSQQLKDLVQPANVPQLSTVVDIRPYLGDSTDGAPGDVTVELFLLTGPS